MPTIKSGAFVQQCFSSHPLSLNLKTVTPPDRVVMACANCDMRHRLTWRSVITPSGEGTREGADDFGKCVIAHPAEVRISMVDVMNDAVKVRCGECRRTYTFDVSAFETYRKEG